MVLISTAFIQCRTKVLSLLCQKLMSATHTHTHRNIESLHNRTMTISAIRGFEWVRTMVFRVSFADHLSKTVMASGDNDLNHLGPHITGVFKNVRVNLVGFRVISHHVCQGTVGVAKQLAVCMSKEFYLHGEVGTHTSCHNGKLHT